MGCPGMPRPGKRLEPADQPLPALHQRHAQPPAPLLASPPLQHRLEQRRLRTQQRRTIYQHQRGGPREPAGLRQRAPPGSRTRYNKPAFNTTGSDASL
jgi:hypothetical protein